MTALNTPLPESNERAPWPLLCSDLEFLHAFYTACDLSDMDAAFEEGKLRAISTLEQRIERIKTLKRADYNRFHGIDEAAQ